MHPITVVAGWGVDAVRILWDDSRIHRVVQDATGGRHNLNVRLVIR